MKTSGPVYARGEVRQGRLRIARSDVLAAELQVLRDGPVEICIERKVATRSQQANRYYFGVVLALLAEDTGHTVDDLHAYFRGKFLPKIIWLDGFEHGTVAGSTARLTVPEFYEYVEQVRAVAARLGTVTPDPDPAWRVPRAEGGAETVIVG